MSLSAEVESARRVIKTNDYAMSIGEWINLYENDEIDINPEFQRFFRWDETQKTNLIESIMLGIPIPPIYVNQREDGVWDVIDGLQRLSTILEFVGILKDEDGKLLPPLVLTQGEQLKSLNRMKYDDKNDPKNSFTMPLRLDFKRSKIHVSIIMKESDQNTKFELFQRLNTGGSSLTDQEVRNCILVKINRNLFKKIKSLAEYDAFQNCIAVSDKQQIEQYDIELALRFIVFGNVNPEELKRIRDVGEFLTNKTIAIAGNKKLDIAGIEEKFKRVFDILDSVMGVDSFRRYDTTKDRFLGGFSISAFEAIALGLAANNNHLIIDEKLIPDKIKSIWKNKTFITSSKSGVQAKRRLPALLTLGRQVFGK